MCSKPASRQNALVNMGKIYKYTMFFVDGSYIDYESNDERLFDFTNPTFVVNASNGVMFVNMNNVTKIERKEVQNDNH